MSEGTMFDAVASADSSGGSPRVSSVGRLIGASLLDSVLAVVTLGIGWLVWAAISVADGATPGKRLMKMKVVDKATGQGISWGKYVFLRGLVGNIILNVPLVGWVLFFMPLWDSQNQSVNGKVSNTLVVDIG